MATFIISSTSQTKCDGVSGASRLRPGREGLGPPCCRGKYRLQSPFFYYTTTPRPTQRALLLVGRRRRPAGEVPVVAAQDVIEDAAAAAAAEGADEASSRQTRCSGSMP